MANDTNLKESILNAQHEDAEKEYKKNVEPMLPDINEFIKTLEKYCLTKKILEVRIIYRIKDESMFGFFGRPIRGKKVIISGWENTEIEKAWEILLCRWYFTANGDYLLSAVHNECLKKGFAFEHDDEGWGWMKEMVHFTL